jgi:hypothetical protein
MLITDMSLICAPLQATWESSAQVKTVVDLS